MKRILKFLIGIMFIIILTIIYARFVGTLGFDTKEYALYEDKLPLGFDGLKVVHFSDIHYNRAITLDKIADIVDEINLINPDIVVFTGDLADQDASLKDNDWKSLTEHLKEIDAKYGKYAVLGNHDYKVKDEVLKVFKDSDFKYLENGYDIIYGQDDEKIFIGGIGNVTFNEDDIDKTMEYLKDNENVDYNIVLVHEPDLSDTVVKNYDVNLILAGHSHNGQIRLPFIGAVYTPNGSKKYYDEYYSIDKTHLYISSGVGVSVINYRLFNRPSINFYRINKSK